MRVESGEVREPTSTSAALIEASASLPFEDQSYVNQIAGTVLLAEASLREAINSRDLEEADRALDVISQMEAIARYNIKKSQRRIRRQELVGRAKGSFLRLINRS